MSKNKTTAGILESKFDAGDDVLDYFDPASAVRVNRVKERVNLDLPKWILDRLDREASRKGVPRQSLIKIWLAERLKQEDAA